MRFRTVLFFSLAVLVGTLVAQETPGAKPDGAAQMQRNAPKPLPAHDLSAGYRLDYVIVEIEDGKRVNARSYTLLVDEGAQGGTMRMGMRVPVQTGEKNMQYMDVGLRIDARVGPRENNAVWVSTRFEVSGLIEQANGVAGAPTVRTVEYSTPAIVQPGKSTVIASGDDLGSKKRFELSVTVTKLR